MPRGSGGSSAGGQASLRGAEQSLHIMRQVKSYFNVGMDHVLEVATNMAENGAGKGEEGQLRKLRQMMLSYVRMERDINIFMTAAEDVIKQGAGDDEEVEEAGGLVGMLEGRLAQLSKGNSDNTLKEHNKYTELEQKIWDSQHPHAVPSSLGRGGPVGDEEEEDVEMTQQQINTKCPYTGKEMVDPVRNTICKHSYDKAGIMHYIKQRGKKAVCPVAGCKNTKPITSQDLEDHREMRRYIHNKRKRTQPSASASVTAGTSRDSESSQSSP